MDMKKYTIKEFLGKLKNKPTEVDEMANWRKMRGENIKHEPIKNEQGELEGWIVDGTPILFTCGVDIKEFEINNPNILNRLKEEFGEDLKWSQGNLTKCKPRRKMDLFDLPKGEDPVGQKSIDVGWKGSEKSFSETTWIKRLLNKQVADILGTDEVSQRLEKLSIPEIKPRERSHINRYGQLNNNKIEYQTHNFNSYLSGADFLKAVMSRVAGKSLPVEYKSYHLARQFNKNYRKWAETKKNEKNYFGKTDVYMLDKYGFDPDNLDVTVRSDLRIDGKLNNIGDAKAYFWAVTLIVKFGKKLKDEYSIGGRLLEDKNIVIQKVVDLDTDKEFTDSETVLHDISIVSGLVEALTELKEKIMTEMKPIDMLPKATTKKEKINEGVDGLINRIVSKLK